MTKRQEPSRHVITCITARVTCKLPQGFNKRQRPHPTLFLSLAFHIKSDSVLVFEFKSWPVFLAVGKSFFLIDGQFLDRQKNQKSTL
uniref:Uncharacterized protein n=1 Tax=Salix viminalis TaxID=40686 RepID=A0A6N2KMR2_SALVM